MTTQARTVGVVTPGAMGSTIASALARGGARVVTTVAGRSQRTAELARRAAAEQLDDLATVVRESDVVLSVVPPGAARAVAVDLAEAARAEGARPLIADLNAVAPSTARDVATTVARAGCDLAPSGAVTTKPGGAGTPRAGLKPVRGATVTLRRRVVAVIRPAGISHQASSSSRTSFDGPEGDRWAADHGHPPSRRYTPAGTPASASVTAAQVVTVETFWSA